MKGRGKEGRDWMTSITVQGIQLVAAFAIFVINRVMVLCIDKLSMAEKHLCVSGYLLSATRKFVFGTFINSGIVSFALFYFDSGLGSLKGLSLAILYVLASNVIMNPLGDLIGPMYRLLQWKRRRVERLLMDTVYQPVSLTQKELNTLWEEPSVNLSMRYGNIMKTYFLSCFFFYILPIGPVICIFYYLLQFWMDKYLILRRNKKFQLLSGDLSLSVARMGLQGIVLMSVGVMLFRWKINGQCKHEDIVLVILSALIYLCPLAKWIHMLRRDGGSSSGESTGEGVPMPRTSKGGRVLTFDRIRHLLDVDYDRLNPLTRDKATREWARLALQRKTDGDKPLFAPPNNADGLVAPEVHRYESVLTPIPAVPIPPLPLLPPQESTGLPIHPISTPIGEGDNALGNRLDDDILEINLIGLRREMYGYRLVNPYANDPILDQLMHNHNNNNPNLPY